jgi:heme/copper-type cytochrome/quinol oxidase subunit 4
MTQQETDQSLEWTFQPRNDWMREARVIKHCIIAIALAPLLALIPFQFQMPDFFAKEPIFWLVVSGISLTTAVILLTCFKGNKKQGLALRIDQRAIILTNTRAYSVEERRINATGAKVFAVYHGFFKRLFLAVDKVSPYYVKITSWNHEPFLFPCNNEMEQRQIVAKIEQIISE